MSQDHSPYQGEGETVYATEPTEDAGAEGRDWPDHTDPEWLHLEYHIKGGSQSDLAEKAGVSNATIARWMKKNEIETRSKSEAVSMARGGDERLRDEDWLRQKYVGEELSLSEIASLRGVPESSVSSALHRSDIQTRSKDEAQELRWESERLDEKYSDPKWLYAQYWRLGKSIGDIAEENGWAKSTVSDAMDSHGIKKRSLKAAQLLRQKREKGVAPSNERELVTRGGIDASWNDLVDIDRGQIVPYRDKQWMQNRVNEGLSSREIAEICNFDVNKGTILRWIDRLGVERPD